MYSVQRGTKSKEVACFAHLPATPEHLLEKQTQPCCPRDTSTEVSPHSHEPPPMLCLYSMKKPKTADRDTESTLSLQKMRHKKIKI